MDGLFGVFRDACPEGYGLEVLKGRAGRPLTSPLEILELASGDAVGAVAVADDVAANARYRPPSVDELRSRLRSLERWLPGSQAIEAVVAQPTALGGERPKATVLHEGQMWIAKVQSRGDAVNAPLREYLAMSIARKVGINAAEVRFERQGDHQALLVKRFDRSVNPDGAITRRLFTSAWTALHLEKTSTRGSDRARSYLSLALQLQRWCAEHGRDVTHMKRELWRRMAFNAVVHNGDDHPRNHGLLHDEGGWKLAPAYDIAPPAVFGGTLAMDVTRDGHSAATRWALLRDCDTFGYNEEEANDFIDMAVDAVRTHWPTAVKAQGYNVADVPAPSAASVDLPMPDDVPPRRRERSRRRSSQAHPGISSEPGPQLGSERSYVYFLYDQSHFKIGLTDDVPRRVAEVLPHACVDRSWLLEFDSRADAHKCEQHLHWLFRRWRVDAITRPFGSTEFFNCDCWDQVKSFVEASAYLLGYRNRLLLRDVASEPALQAPLAPAAGEDLEQVDLILTRRSRRRP